MRDRHLYRKARRIWIEQGRRCACCDRLIGPDRLEVDHVIPLRDGGDDSRENLRVLSKACHYERHRFDNVDPAIRESKRVWWNWLKRTERELAIRRIS